MSCVCFAAERSPDSYIAGGVAIKREGTRLSGDSDICQDTEQRLQATAADRREPRDIVDLVTIHESILTARAAIWAAVGQFQRHAGAPGGAYMAIIARDIKRDAGALQKQNGNGGNPKL